MRQKTITRTITVYYVNALALDLETNETYETTVKATSVKKTNEKTLTALNKEEGSKVKYIHIFSIQEKREKYQMLEKVFLQFAVPVMEPVDEFQVDDITEEEADEE